MWPWTSEINGDANWSVKFIGMTCHLDRPVFECAKLIVAWLFFKSQIGNQ